MIRESLRTVELTDPKVPVWSNALAAPMEEATEISRALVRQLVEPVRWSDSIRKMIQQGVVGAVEMGPGKVLSGIVRRIDRRLPVWLVETPRDMDRALERIGA